MRGVFIAALLTTGLAASLSAQGQQQAPKAEEMPLTILTGCLRSSAADTAVAGPSGRIYTLEVVDTPAAAPAVTTAGTPPPAPSVTTYSLAAQGDVNLEPHADHQVQLTGRLQAPSTATSGSPAGASAAPRPTTAGGGHRTFEVTALKMIARKCGG